MYEWAKRFSQRAPRMHICMDVCTYAFKRRASHVCGNAGSLVSKVGGLAGSLGRDYQDACMGDHAGARTRCACNANVKDVAENQIPDKRLSSEEENAKKGNRFFGPLVQGQWSK